MMSNQTIENDSIQLFSDGMDEKKAILEYSSNKYCFKIQLKKDMNDLKNKEKIIVINVVNENSVERFFFEKTFKFKDFKKLGNIFL
eukprot:jgi/Orpsp1_1/1177238/evm.model.c7180000060664.1